jgi:hypothetical protein
MSTAAGVEAAAVAVSAVAGWEEELFPPPQEHSASSNAAENITDIFFMNSPLN